MKKYFFGLLMVSLVALPAIQPIAARAASVSVENTTSDAWVWVTAYADFSDHGRKVGYWCVNPGEHSDRNVGRLLGTLRGEVTHKNCQHPRMADLGCKLGPGRGANVHAVLRGSAGKYTFNCS